MIGCFRNLEKKADNLLKSFPILAILGARQTGKSTLSKKLKAEWLYLDLERPRSLERLQYDPDFFFSQHPTDVIFDEAQEYPDLFKILRGVVDEDRGRKGRFILTGSSSPELLHKITETLAGRIAIVELGTLKANEFYQKPLSPLYEIFKQPLHKKNLIALSDKMPISLEEMRAMWFWGGYPEPVLSQNPLYYQQWMDNYYDTYIFQDLGRLFPKMDKIAYRLFLSMLGNLSGSILNKREIGRAIEVSETTVRDYLAIAEGTFIWRMLPSFEHNVMKSIVKMPKGYVRDTGLLHYLNQIGSADALFAHPLIGASFEAFVIEEILKGLEVTDVFNWEPYYYRTRNGAEIDLVLKGPFGILPIEIKHGSTPRMQHLKSLSEFIEDHKLPFGLLINQSQKAEWITPTIFQLPTGWL